LGFGWGGWVFVIWFFCFGLSVFFFFLVFFCWRCEPRAYRLVPASSAPAVATVSFALSLRPGPKSRAHRLRRRRRRRSSSCSNRFFSVVARPASSPCRPSRARRPLRGSRVGLLAHPRSVSHGSRPDRRWLRGLGIVPEVMFAGNGGAGPAQNISCVASTDAPQAHASSACFDGERFSDLSPSPRISRGPERRRHRPARTSAPVLHVRVAAVLVRVRAATWRSRCSVSIVLPACARSSREAPKMVLLSFVGLEQCRAAGPHIARSSSWPRGRAMRTRTS